jgi:outer membrane protein assembly factor BamB
VLALDKNSGRELWRSLDDPANFSSPVLVNAGGKKQLVVWTQRFVTALDLETGQSYWQERYTGGSRYAVPTPVFDAERHLLFVNGMMFQLAADRPAASLLWPDRTAPARQLVSETSSAYLKAGHLFTCNVSGELVCVEAQSGRLIWATNQVAKATNGGCIHLIPNGAFEWLLNEQGELILARLTPRKYEELGRVPFIKPTSPYGPARMAWTAPAFAYRCMFARNDEELLCVSLAAEK